MIHSICKKRFHLLIQWVARFFFFLIPFVILVIVHTPYTYAESVTTIDREVEVAVLAEDWEKVAKLLDSVNPETSSPVLRMIKGHADLALNKNNESLNLFLSVVASDNEVERWEQWSLEFMNKNPQKAIAHYLRGDALSRSKRWQDAKLSFKKALYIYPNHVLTLNARGVVHSQLGEFDAAFNDFIQAIDKNKNIADVYSNLGMIAIQLKEGTKGAIDDFNKSINLSPQFAIAFYGRACTRLVSGQFDKAEIDLDTSLTNVNSKGNKIFIVIKKAVEDLKSSPEPELDQNNPGFAIASKTEKAINAMNKGDLGFRGSKYKAAVKEASAQYAQGNSEPLRKLEKATVNYMKNYGNEKYIARYNNQVRTETMTNSLVSKVTERHSTTMSTGVNIGIENANKMKDTTRSGVNVKAGSSYQNEVTYDLGLAQSGYRKAAAGIDQFSGRLAQKHISMKPQGFKTQPVNGNIDIGDWQYTGLYGLMYSNAIER